MLKDIKLINIINNGITWDKIDHNSAYMQEVHSGYKEWCKIDGICLKKMCILNDKKNQCANTLAFFTTFHQKADSPRFLTIPAPLKKKKKSIFSSHSIPKYRFSKGITLNRILKVKKLVQSSFFLEFGASPFDTSPGLNWCGALQSVFLIQFVGICSSVWLRASEPGPGYGYVHISFLAA